MDRKGMTNEDFNFLVARYGCDAAEHIYSDYRNWCLRQNGGVYDPEAYSRHFATKGKKGEVPASHRFGVHLVASLTFLATLGLTVPLMVELDAPDRFAVFPLILALAAPFGAVRLYTRWRKS